MRLPTNGLWDTVRTKDEVSENPPGGLLSSVVGWLWPCLHESTTEFTHIDHRAGPGSFADTYLGIVCRDCRHVLTRVEMGELPHEDRLAFRRSCL